MATATVTGLTNITAAEASTGWASIGGGAGASLTNDIYVQGTGAIGRRVGSASTLLGFWFDFGTNIDFTVADRYLWIWINVALGPTGMQTRSAGGLRLRVGTTTANYAEWYVGGGDITKSGWKRYIIDLNTTPSATGGTGLTVSQCRHFGVTYNFATPPGGNIPHVIVDSIDYGGTLVVTGGTSGDRLKWSDIALYTDGSPATRTWGVLQEKNGVYFANGNIQIGDNTGTGTAYLNDTEGIIVFESQEYHTGSVLTNSVPHTLQGITISSNATGVTEFQDGIKVGTGDSASGSKGSVFQTATGSQNQLHFIASDADVDKVLLYGTKIIRSANAIQFSDDPTLGPNHELAGVIFDGGARATVGRVVTRNCIFSGYTGANAAMLMTTDTDIKNCEFRSNTDATNNPAGIEHTVSATITYDGLTFSGNDFDLFYSQGSGTLTINATNDSNPVTSLATGTGTVVINNAVTITITVKNETGVAVQGARVRIQTDLGAMVTEGTTNASGIYTTSYNFSGVTPVLVRVRLKGYIPFDTTGDITTSGLNVGVRFIKDTIVD